MKLALARRGAVREDVHLDMVVTRCFGSCFADYLRAGREVPADFAERVVATAWPALAVGGEARSARGGPPGSRC